MSSDPKTNKDEITDEQAEKVVGGFGRVGSTDGDSSGKDNDTEVQDPTTLPRGPELA